MIKTVLICTKNRGDPTYPTDMDVNRKPQNQAARENNQTIIRKIHEFSQNISYKHNWTCKINHENKLQDRSGIGWTSSEYVLRKQSRTLQGILSGEPTKRRKEGDQDHYGVESQRKKMDTLRTM